VLFSLWPTYEKCSPYLIYTYIFLRRPIKSLLLRQNFCYCLGPGDVEKPSYHIQDNVEGLAYNTLLYRCGGPLVCRYADVTILLLRYNRQRIILLRTYFFLLSFILQSCTLYLTTVDVRHTSYGNVNKKIKNRLHCIVCHTF
jgi:hypothetical protein